MIDVPALQPVNPLGGIQQAMQIRASQQEQAMRQQAMQAQQLEMEQRQRQMDSQNAIMDAYRESNGDINKLPSIAAKSGRVLPGDLMNLQKGIMEMKAQTLDYVQKVGAKAVNDSALMQGAHDQVAALPPDQRPAAYQQALASLKGAGVDVSQMPPQYPGDQAFAQFGPALKTHDQLVKEAAAKLEDEKTIAQTGEANAKASEAKANAAFKDAESQWYKQGGLAPGVPVEAVELKSFLQNNPGKTPQDFAKWKASLAPTATVNLQAGLLNDQAKQMAAQMYAQTGQLPHGMRSPAMSAQVLNAAAQTGVNGQDIIANKGINQANAASLKKMQENFDNVTAFENTAGKNLDQFLKTAKDVIDTGSPFLNTPLRQINAKMVGSDKMAAFNAARQTALTEISKVLSSANAGSGMVSDSARHEVESLIGPDASLKQIYAAANILKQDMANRHQSYASQIEQIKARSRGKADSSQNDNSSSDPFSQFGGSKR